MVIDLNGAWQRYIATVPNGAHVIGLLSMPSGKEGALVQFESSGTYVLVRHESSSTLDQSEVVARLRHLRSTAEGIS